MEEPTTEEIIDSTKSKRLPVEVFTAYKNIWNTDINNAEKVLLDKQAQANGKVNLWVELALGEILLWKFGLDEKDETKKGFEKQLDKLEKLAKMLIEEHDPDSIGNRVGSLFGGKSDPKDIETKKKSLMRYFDGLAVSAMWHFLSSVWCFRWEERVKGAYHFQRAWSKLSDILETIQKIEKAGMKVDPSLQGMVDFGVGFFHFVFSLIPPSLQVITHIVGFVADRERAIVELEQAIKSGCCWAPYAVILLSSLKQFFLDEKEDSIRLLGTLQKAFPNGVVTCYFSGYFERMIGNPGGSLDYFNKALQLVPDNEKIGCAICYQIGYTHFLLNEWEAVIPLFERFLARPVKDEQDKAFRPFAAYILGFCYWITDLSVSKNDSVKKILELYSKVRDWIRPEESYDKYAKRKVAEFTTQKHFDEFDVLFVKADALKEGRQFKRSLEIVEQMRALLDDKERMTKVDPKWSKEGEAIYWYLKGGCERGEKNYDQAKEYFMNAIQLAPKIKKESWVIPMTWLMLGEMAMEEKKYNEVSQHFERVEKFKDYDWERIVSVRLFGSKQTLEKYIKVK